jgi:hypothetical protein
MDACIFLVFIFQKIQQEITSRVRVHDYNMDGPPPKIMTPIEMQRIQCNHMHS